MVFSVEQYWKNVGEKKKQQENRKREVTRQSRFRVRQKKVRQDLTKYVAAIHKGNLVDPKKLPDVALLSRTFLNAEAPLKADDWRLAKKAYVNWYKPLLRGTDPGWTPDERHMGMMGVAAKANVKGPAEYSELKRRFTKGLKGLGVTLSLKKPSLALRKLARRLARRDPGKEIRAHARMKNELHRLANPNVMNTYLNYLDNKKFVDDFFR